MTKTKSAFNLIRSTFLVMVVVSISAPANSAVPAIVSTKGSVSFELNGTEGMQRAKTNGSFSITTDKEIVLQFSASDLAYVGPHQEEARLETAEYWLNDNRNWLFKPGKSLVLNRKAGTHQFKIHGQVSIDAVEDYPAGEYLGTIHITIHSAE